ncbi:MAG TPA: L-aspartate oxidase, partial [Cyanobacteria bacterium UBA8156]|nr:L-aspartate oxidase [Cyanobacteria bacterium UBA8156]
TADTLKAGASLCEPAAVEILTTGARAQIDRLVQQYRVAFDRTSAGDLALTLEAAHSRRRVLHAADATGKALIDALMEAIPEGLSIFTEAIAVDLDVRSGRCQGVWVWQEGELSHFGAKAVVLATGGAASAFAQSTNPPGSTGDGLAMAWRGGAILRDLEFMQFHPTALAVAGAPRFLISEAVRGEGAHVVDARGDRFLLAYEPAGELAPRDRVSRAIFSHLQCTGEPVAYVDLRPIPAAQIAHRFPNIARVCQEWQIDIYRQPIPVTPAAHYGMGGIATDTWGGTSLPGLYAIGETASTGVHGANRLASNSLLECFVFGDRLAQRLATLTTTVIPPEIVPTFPSPGEVPPCTVADIQQLLWNAAGIVREGAILAKALAQVEHWRANHRACFEPDSLALRNLLDVAKLMLQSALARTESRGGHFRADFPDTDPHWAQHTLIQGDILRPYPLNQPLPYTL